MDENNRTNSDRGSHSCDHHGNTDRGSGPRCGDGLSGSWYGVNDPMREGYSLPIIGPRASLTVGLFAVLSLILMGAL